MSDIDDELRREFQRGCREERAAIMSIVLSAIHSCRLLKQNTSQLEEVKAAIKQRGNAPPPSSTSIPIVRVTLKKELP